MNGISAMLDREKACACVDLWFEDELLYATDHKIQARVGISDVDTMLQVRYIARSVLSVEKGYTGWVRIYLEFELEPHPGCEDCLLVVDTQVMKRMPHVEASAKEEIPF